MIPVFIAMFIYAFVHSVLASHSLKARIKNLSGESLYEGFYRAFYNLFALITILPVLWIVKEQDAIIWELGKAWDLPFAIVNFIGLMGLSISLLQIDFLRFAGIRQMMVYLRGGTLPLADEPLQTGGLFKIVRHPLYLFSMVTMWPVTTMSAGYFGFCITATLYFFIGSIFEERRMEREIGQPYLHYQQRVPRFIPSFYSLIIGSLIIKD